MSNIVSSSQTIFDTLFGCCLGRRRNENQLINNESTPLLRGENSNSNSIQSEQQSPLNVKKVNSNIENNYQKRNKKQQIDSKKLNSIKFKAEIAFFDIENDQLLPSSSSLAQKKQSMGNSQKSNNFIKKSNSKDEKLKIQQKELINSSDKAERLYKAALKSLNDKNLIHHDQKDLPIGLVRQIRLSIFDDEISKNSRKSFPKFSIESSSSESSMNSNINIMNDHNTTISRMSSIRNNDKETNTSTHSLTTLKLKLKSDQSFDQDSTNLMISKSLQSSNNDTISTEDDQEDENWKQRGRTRSKRGLVWMDTSVNNKEQQQQQQQSNLKEIWPDKNQHDQDEIPHGLKFNIGTDNDDGYSNNIENKRKKIVEKLEKSLKNDEIEFFQSWQIDDFNTTNNNNNNNGNGNGIGSIDKDL